MSAKLRTRDVFIPGGQPQHTYVSRDEHRLEDEIRASADNLCKLVTVTGPTKSGKSVLVTRVFPRQHAVWIDGGSVAAEDDLWTQVIERLAAATTTTTTAESASNFTGTLELGGEAGVYGVGKIAGKTGVAGSRGSKSATTTSRASTHRAAALLALQRSRRPLIIDDFHYLSEGLQRTFIRAIKALVYEGHPTLILAIPHRRYDAVRVEREMTGRVQQVNIPIWSVEELRRIPDVGLPLLNATADDGLVELFTAEALGSPHLVQEFFRELCIRAGIQETADRTVEARPQPSATAVLSDIANHLSRPVFDALARGPRQRSDRLQREFRDGRTGDIYLAVLHAIARLKTGMATLDYEQIRSSLRELVVDLPQANEVSRVLEHMSTIQADQGASAPVIDWDKQHRRLHVTDPYFAFFLKWGADVFAATIGETHSASVPARAKQQPRGSRTPGSRERGHAAKPRRHTGPAQGRRAAPGMVQGTGRALNLNELTVIRCLTDHGVPMTLASLAAKAFPMLSPQKANSWVRNSVRKPLALGLIQRTQSGTYAVAGRRRKT